MRPDETMRGQLLPMRAIKTSIMMNSICSHYKQQPTPHFIQPLCCLIFLANLTHPCKGHSAAHEWVVYLPILLAIT